MDFHVRQLPEIDLREGMVQVLGRRQEKELEVQQLLLGHRLQEKKTRLVSKIAINVIKVIVIMIFRVKISL
jgi:hypothetical protein